MGTPSLCVVIDAKRKAKVDEKRTVVANQKLEPRRRMDKNRDRNVRCIERYPRNIIVISRVSAFWIDSLNVNEDQRRVPSQMVVPESIV